MPTTPEELKALANVLAPEIDKHLPADVSFSLFVFNCETRDGVEPEPDNNNLYYISSAKRTNMVHVISGRPRLG